MGDRLEAHCIDCLTNPLGTIYSPLALAEILRLAIQDEPLTESSFFLHDEIWRHHLVHEAFATISKELSVKNANQQLKRLSTFLREANCIIITLGTAWSYSLKAEPQSLIGHNHKLPLERFSKELLKPDEIAESLAKALKELISVNNRIQIIITVSPVKHLRDGIHENNLSKSSLLLACDSLIRKYDRISYFPAFEIVQDELRDYRFYAADMAHPSAQASEYIWKQFLAAIFDRDTKQRIEEITAINNSLNHRPTHPETQAYQHFKKNLFQRIQNLEAAGLNVEKLETSFKRLP